MSKNPQQNPAEDMPTDATPMDIPTVSPETETPEIDTAEKAVETVVETAATEKATGDTAINTIAPDTILNADDSIFDYREPAEEIFMEETASPEETAFSEETASPAAPASSPRWETSKKASRSYQGKHARPITTDKRRRKKRNTLLTALVLFLVLLATALVLYFWQQKALARADSYDRIFPGVTAAGVDLGGMTEEEAVAALDAQSRGYFAFRSLTLTYDTGEEILTREISCESFGLCFDSQTMAQEAMACMEDLTPEEKQYRLKGEGEVCTISTKLLWDENKLYEAICSFTESLSVYMPVPKYEISGDTLLVYLTEESLAVNPRTAVTAVEEMIAQDSFGEYTLVPEAATPETLDLEKVREAIYCEASDARICIVPQGWTEAKADQFDFDLDHPEDWDGELTWVILSEKEGVDFSLEEAQSLLAAAGDVTILEIPLERTSPTVTKSELRLLVFRDKIGSASTQFGTTNTNRVNNITLAAASLNGKIILPGETFSYNEALGRRTESKGYLPAGAYVKDETVETVGGGICQVSTTLYMASLQAGLKIVERHAHRFAVNYTDPGQDATVYWGSLDYRMKNNTDYPILIRSSVEDDTVKITLYGTNLSGETHQIVSEWEVLETYEETDIYVDVESEQAVELGLDHAGQRTHTGGYEAISADTWLVTLDKNGNEISRDKLSHSDYKKSDRVNYIACYMDDNGNPLLNSNGKPLKTKPS